MNMGGFPETFCQRFNLKDGRQGLPFAPILPGVATEAAVSAGRGRQGRCVPDPPNLQSESDRLSDILYWRLHNLIEIRPVQNRI